jgi:plasmid stabilization system protein ParE
MRICWTDLAARDLTEICDYIEERNSTSTAHRVAVSIRDRVTALVEFPESGTQNRDP